MVRLEGVRLKIERAKKHIVDLDSRVKIFCDCKPYTLAAKPHPVAQINHTCLYVASVTPVPDEFALIVGDAVHNLRSSLDHLAWQLVEAGGGTPGRNTCFPISESAKKYASAVKNGVIKGMAVGAQKLIESVQRYKTGDETLWVLHELDIIDKHRLLITAVSTMDKWGVDIFKGHTMWFDENRFLFLKPGYEVVNIPTSTYERTPQENFKLGIDIAFGESQVAEGELVVFTLNKLADFLDGLVSKFERFLI